MFISDTGSSKCNSVLQVTHYEYVRIQVTFKNKLQLAYILQIEVPLKNKKKNMCLSVVSHK